jgi:hemerythrin
MPLFQWSDALSVGVASIDDEHRTLVAILNELHDALLERRAPAVLDDVFQRLIAYTEEHFSHEEALLAEHGYPDLVTHRAQHLGLTRRVHELYDAHHAGERGLSLEVLEFLRDWLRNHIVGTDRRYAAHLAACGVR